MANPHDSAARGLDAVAVDAVLRRLAAAPQAPWLHGEVARRMAQRLAVIRLQPASILDWWGFLGAGAQCLAQAYPNARRVVVEPTSTWVAHSRGAVQRPWWSARRWRAGAVEVICQTDPMPSDVQLVSMRFLQGMFTAALYATQVAIVSAAFAPFYQLLIWGGGPIAAAVAVMGLLLIWRHSANIQKLLKGTESRLGQKAAPAVAAHGGKHAHGHGHGHAHGHAHGNGHSHHHDKSHGAKP